MNKNRYFTNDRLVKYGFGTVRLLTLISVVLCTCHFFLKSESRSSLLLRCTTYAFLGTFGACLNVLIFNTKTNILGMLMAASVCLLDAQIDGSIVIYLLKTFVPDALAGKIDSKEWKWVVGVSLSVIALCASWDVILFGHARILILLSLIQFICEWGDGHWEHVTFFRHRYSFELFSALLWCIPLKEHEETVFILDLIACLCYRWTNFILCVWHHPEMAQWNQSLSRSILEACFRIHFWRKRIPFMRVRDPNIARSVLKSSHVKGHGLEKYIASPAWAPLLSLESVDPPVWESMRLNFNVLLKHIPKPGEFVVVLEEKLNVLIESNTILDAHQIAHLTMDVFVSVLFGNSHPRILNTLVDACYEWRKEIAVRGKGSLEKKQAAIDCVVNELLPHSPLWSLFGFKWKHAEYYSLLMQPFLISPCINMCDIAIAFKEDPLLPPEAAIRSMHPFPVLERFIDSPIYNADGSVCIPKGTCVILFTSDFSQDELWSIYGYGRRSCAGISLMQPFLKSFHSKVYSLDSFAPHLHHQHSGRHHDTVWTLAETFYFIQTVWRLILSP